MSEKPLHPIHYILGDRLNVCLNMIRQIDTSDTSARELRYEVSALDIARRAMNLAFGDPDFAVYQLDDTCDLIDQKSVSEVKWPPQSFHTVYGEFGSLDSDTAIRLLFDASRKITDAQKELRVTQDAISPQADN